MNLKTTQFSESLNKPYKYTWQAFKADRTLGAFVLDDNSWIDLNIQVSQTLQGLVIASVVFSRGTEDNFEDYSITGGGDAFRIFATVMKMINEWIKKYGEGINVLEFTAEKKDDPKGSRTRLYSTLSKKFTPKGWTYSRGDGTGKNVRFKFINNNFNAQKSIYKI